MLDFLKALIDFVTDNLELFTRATKEGKDLYAVLQEIYEAWSRREDRVPVGCDDPVQGVLAAMSAKSDNELLAEQVQKLLSTEEGRELVAGLDPDTDGAFGVRRHRNTGELILLLIRFWPIIKEIIDTFRKVDAVEAVEPSEPAEPSEPSHCEEGCNECEGE